MDLNKFTFVDLKYEHIEEDTTEDEELKLLGSVKVECDEDNDYILPTGTNFIDITEDQFVVPETLTINDIQPEKDPLAEQDLIKEEIHEAPLEGCLTDYVIPEDQDMLGVKQEDEVIIDDSLMDWHEEYSSTTADWPISKSNEFKCKYCAKTFNAVHELDEHELTHKDNELLFCHVCFEKFTKADLLKHVMELHKETLFTARELACEICHKICRTMNSLRNHTLFHKVERKLQCAKCKNIIHWVGSLQQFNAYQNGEKPFLCESCNKIPSSKLFDILTTKKMKPKESLPTPSSTITSSTVSNLSKIATVTNQGPAVSCDICYLKFNSYPELLVHQSEHKVRKELLCLSCGIMTNWSGTLGQCNKYVKGEEEFVCAKCIVSKGMKCAVCKNVVNCFSGTIRLFTKIVDNVQQHEQQFVCSPCNIMSKVTNTSPDADSNMFITQVFKSILPKQPEIINFNGPITQSMTSQPGLNICILCNATFDSFLKLQSHKKIHKVQSQIHCTNCKKVIKWFGSLANLEGFISGSKKIICSECVDLSMNKQNPKYVHANVTCNNCLVSIKWVGTLAQLEKYTSKLEKIICESCENSVRIINRNLVQNEKQCVQTNVTCSICQRMFQWNGTFSLLAVIMSGKGKVVCPVCQKSAEVSIKLPKVKQKARKSLSCRICKKRFVKVDKSIDLKCSKNFKEISCRCCTKNNEFVCDPCSSKTLTQKEMTLICDLCKPIGKLLFTDVTSFLTHIKCHTAIKDFVCKICNKIGYWGNDLDGVNDFKCRRCNTDESLVEFSKLTKENIIFENKIVDHFNTTPMIEKELECCTCKKLYPWCGNEKQLKEFTSGSKTYICLKCYGQIQ